MRKVTVLLGMLALAAAGVIVLLVALGRRDRSGDAATLPSTPSAPTSQTPLEDDAGRVAAANRDTVEEGATTPASSTVGVLRIAFVSAADGTPVPDLPFVVSRERPGRKELLRGRSDAQGRAEARDLEENVILVETARRPPFARKIAACWLARGDTKELVVRLDRGARVTGRIVDDLKQPVPGAQIVVDGDMIGADEGNTILDLDPPSAVTGGDGRFVVEHVSDQQRGVWIVDGEERPESWDPAQLFARDGAEFVNFSADVKPGANLDVGDIVLGRRATIAGTVVESEGRVLPGALVSPRFERKPVGDFHKDTPDEVRGGFGSAPGQDGFRLHADEVLTDADGRFEVRAAPNYSRLVVWSASGRRQWFEERGVGPGERRDGVVLRLDGTTSFELELRDERGRPITGPGPAALTDGLRITRTPGRSFSERRSICVIVLDDGTSESVDPIADAEGIVRTEWRAPIARMVTLEIDIAGYLPLVDRIVGKASAGARLSYVLKEMPAIRLRLKANPPPPPGQEIDPNGLFLLVQDCLATPAQRERFSSRAFGAFQCCGLGATIHIQWRGEDRDLVIPAVDPRPYWIYLRGYKGTDGVADLLSFGPFEAGEAVHEIEADPVKLRDLAPKAGKPERAPPEKSEPGGEKNAAFLSLRVVDSGKNEALKAVRVQGKVRPGAVDDRSWRWLQFTFDERADRQRVSPGAFDLVVSAKGHRTKTIESVDLHPGQHTDLGTIALDPLPVYRGRLTSSDGTPVTTRTWVRASAIGGSPESGTWSAETDADGRFSFDGELPNPVLVRVNELWNRVGGGPRGGQILVVDDWRAGDERALALGRWQDVEVRVGGAALEPVGNTLLLAACPSPGASALACDYRIPSAAGHQHLLDGQTVDPAASPRVFRFRAAPGRYQVFGQGLLHEVSPQEIEVRDASEKQVFDLSSL